MANNPKGTKSGRNERSSPLWECPSFAGQGKGSILDLLDALQNPLLDAIRQWGVIERRSHALALGDRPVQELHKLFAFGRVFLLFIHEQPGRARNRIRLLARGIDHRETEIVRYLRGR